MSHIRAVCGEAHARHAPPSVFSGGAMGAAYDSPQRVSELLEALADLGATVESPHRHPDEVLLAVHDPGLICFLREGWKQAQAQGPREAVVPDIFPHQRLIPSRDSRKARATRARPGAWCFDCSSPLLAGTWEAAREAVDVALSAAQLLLAGEQLAYALCRPPGHHAGRDVYGGFCYFNNAALAAACLRESGRRVALLDLDIHHGNGTQAIFWDDPSVLTVSVHEHPDSGYPYFTGYEDERGGDAAPGTNVNVTVPAGCGDGAYLDALGRALAAVETFAADLLVVPFGADGHRDDPLSSTELTLAAYSSAGESVAALHRPTLVVQEGGYTPGALRASLEAFLGALTS